ncbi:glycoside hydrolase superfamily [Xylariaceae sp. FL0594]|nr:glycoside hydrolase superfamily [Xylariaceae sp. FL0594]
MAFSSWRKLTAIFAGAATAAAAAAESKTTLSIPVPTGLSTRPLVADVYGYSIEPIWVDAYTNTSLARTLLAHIASVTGKAPPIRVGGNTADQTYLYPTSPLPQSGTDSLALPNLTSANRFDVTPRWYKTWASYFPEGTEITYTLNLADNSSAWANAVAQAEAVHVALGRSLVTFELGNEIDHFISKHWRDATWGVDEYIVQFRNLTSQITGSAWYRALNTGKKVAPTFQAAVFADPPLVPDQQDEMDDFTIANLTAAGIASRPEDKDLISSYATHLYPQSTCDPARYARLRLDLLSNHLVLWQNVSQYMAQIAAAEASGGAPLVMGETNSASCSGKSGISDTFGAALWAVDYVLTAASLGFRKVYFHLGAHSEYSAFTPLGGYELKGEVLDSGIRSTWYAHYFLARVVAGVPGSDPCHSGGQGGEDSQGGTYGLRVAALPAANSSSLSGFAIYGASYDNEKRGQTVSESLRKLVFLDMGVWNGTDGLSNPSTLSATDGAVFSEGERPVSVFEVATPWDKDAQVRVVRLTAPGTNAKSKIAVAGTTFDAKTGDPVVGGVGSFGDEVSEIVNVGGNGVVSFDVQRAEAVLLEVVLPHDDDDRMCSGSPGSNGMPPEAQNDGSPQRSALFATTIAATFVGLSAALRMIEPMSNYHCTSNVVSSSATGAGVNTGAGTTREKTEAEIEADRRYEEAMEDEYAKREGGA